MLSSIVISIILLFVDKVTAFYTNYRPKILVTKSKVIKGLKDTLIPDGFCIAKDSRGNHVQAEKLKQPIRIYSLDQLRKMIFNGYRVRDLDVRGDTRSEKESDINKVHPAIQALYDRAKVNSIAGERNDGKKIAIAIEGGGMRGSVAAGMITAFWHLGLQDSIDVIYGSSAGSMVGAYFISEQLPYDGPEIYYDVLTSAGKEFIDAQSILRCAGLGVFDLRLDSIVKLYKDRMGKPVLNLNYLFDTIVAKLKPFDWNTFWHKQKTNKTQLKVVASGLLSHKAVVMSAENQNFQKLEELGECMKASMLLPGITGDVVRLKGSQASSDNIAKTWWREYHSRNDVGKLVLGSEPLSDALIFEPVPYRSAVRENCTHVIALRTRADDLTVTAKMSLIEKMIMSRYFSRKQGMPEIAKWMHNQYHKLVYAEDILMLNEASKCYDGISSLWEGDDFATNSTKQRMKELTNGAELFCIALPKGVPEVKRMETSREVIFQSVRDGFAAAYDSLVVDPALKGKGMEVAKQIWPDSILSEIPKHLLADDTLTDVKKTEFVVQGDADYSPDDDIIERELLKSDAALLPPSDRSALVRGLKRLQAMVTGKPIAVDSRKLRERPEKIGKIVTDAGVLLANENMVEEAES